MASNSYYAWIHDLVFDNLNGTTIKLLLVNATDTADKVNDEFVTDIVANELSDASYARKTLASVTYNENSNSHAVWVDAADVLFSALNNETIEAAYVYREVTNDTDSYLIARLDGVNLVANGGDVTVTFDATGGIVYFNA